VASLRIVTGELSGTTVEIAGELLIGRADADLTLDDAEVSRRHAIVRQAAGRLQVEDLGSSNGTFVDGTRITAPTALDDGARLTIGTTELVVEGREGSNIKITGPLDPNATKVAAVAELDTREAPSEAAMPPAGPDEPPHAPKAGAGGRFDRSRLGSRRVVAALVIAAAVAAGLLAYFLTSGGSAKASPVDVPVRFTVKDVNRSVLPCKASGSTYQLAGRLVEPSSSAGSAATVYMAGVIFSSLFEFHNDLVPGYDYARDLAALGHTSVVIDRVGYGTTHPYPADGRGVCLGAQADMLHQVVQELRTGRYSVSGSSGLDPKAFARVGVAGYSLGGLIAEIEAASFRDARSLVTVGWAEQGFTKYAAATPYVLAHCKPGLAKPPDGRVGYFRTVAASKVPLLVSPQADPRVRPLFAKNEELDACGQFLTAGQWFGGLAGPALRRVGFPVLVVYGDYDVLYQPIAWPAQLAHFTGTRDRTLVGIPDGQMLMLDHHASLTRHVIADWLQAHKF